MSEWVSNAPERGADPAVAPVPHSPGAALRRARESTGIHIAALAVAMKVPVKKLEALEGDRWDLLPDVVFVRALASSMCRALKIDASPILAMLPKQDVPKLEAQARGANTPFAVPRVGGGQSTPGWIRNPALWLVLVLLLGCVGVAFWPELQRWGGLSSDDASALPATMSSATPVEMSVTETVPSGAASDAAVPAPMATSSEEMGQVPQGNTAPSPIATQPVVVAAAVAPATPASAVVNTITPAVSFHAKAPSWVEVTDAKGVVQLRRILAEGERLRVEGALPLSVVVGRADAVDVELKGQPFPLASIAKENVARFEVKP